ncbi:hypothetical protein AB0J52_35750, partial [Spirillospora sp. NPDC049652]
AQAASAEWERGLLRHPASRAEAWPGGGHRLHAERPAEFTLVVRRWLDALDRARTADAPAAPAADSPAASAAPAAAPPASVPTESAR